MQIDRIRMEVDFCGSTIAINGEGYTCPVEPRLVHAAYGIAYILKWFGRHGFVKYERGPSLNFTDTAQIEAYVALWEAARVTHLTFEAELHAAHLDAITKQRLLLETRIGVMQRRNLLRAEPGVPYKRNADVVAVENIQNNIDKLSEMEQKAKVKAQAIRQIATAAVAEREEKLRGGRA